MKATFTLLIMLAGFCMQAQVKFELANVKNKNLHVVYMGMVNTFKITLPKESSIKNITPSSGNLRMMDEQTFVYYVHTEDEQAITFTYELMKSGLTDHETYPISFKVKKVPDYFQLRIGEYVQNGKASLSSLLKNNQIGLNDKDFNGDLKNITATFDFSITSAQGKSGESTHIESNRTADIKKFQRALMSLHKGDKLVFTHVKADAGDGVTRDMPDLNLQIN